MTRIALDAEAGQVSAELASRGIPAEGRVHVLIEVLNDAPLRMTAIVAERGAFDWFAEEPNLYTDADLLPAALPRN